MGGLLLSVQWLWGFSVTAQVTVFSLLFLKGSFRKLPLFTTYVGLNLCQATLLFLLYSHHGISSRTVAAVGWGSEAVTLVAQGLATTEVLRLVLNPYRGIWGLAWRLLAALLTPVLIIVALDARANVAWAIVVADRGYHLTFATAVIACLLFIRYYSVAVPPVYKSLLAGFCFYSCTTILINTLVQSVWHPHNTSVEPIWQAVTTLSFAIVQVAWAVALRNPLPAEDPQRMLHSASIYLEISPAINEQLRLLNEKLLRLWKLEARSH